MIVYSVVIFNLSTIVMVDKCPQIPPSSIPSAQRPHLSTSLQLDTGQTIEDQLNSKGEPPEKALPVSANNITSSNEIKQMMRFDERMLRENEVKQLKGEISEEEALTMSKSGENDGKSSGEEAESLGSEKSKSTHQSTPEDWFNQFNGKPQEYNNYVVDGVCPYSLCFFSFILDICVPPKKNLWVTQNM